MARLSKVAVVGGGIGGLTAALALLREGIDVDVYERAPEGGWAPAFRSARRNTRLAWRSSASPRSRGGEGHPALEHGPELQAVRSRRGFPRALWISLRIHAPAGFARHAGGGNPTPKLDALHLGIRCVGVAQSETGVTLRFHTSEIAQAARTIGADGVHSIVRGSLFGVASPQLPAASAAGAEHGALRLALHLRRHGGSNLSRGRRAARPTVRPAAPNPRR
jgi:salicylate hydroxylase